MSVYTDAIASINAEHKREHGDHQPADPQTIVDAVLSQRADIELTAARNAHDADWLEFSNRYMAAREELVKAIKAADLTSSEEGFAYSRFEDQWTQERMRLNAIRNILWP